VNGHNEVEIVNLFGERVGEILIEAGFGELQEIRDSDDDDLLEIDGIGVSTAAMIRQKLADREKEEEAVETFEMEIEVEEDLPGVLETEATSDPEVKPVEVEAEAAEEVIAEESSAEEAVAEYAPAMGPNVAIQSLWPARMKVVAPSGSEYFWPKAGSVTHVMASDVEFVMSKNRNVGRACCGASAERIYFQIL
jgi:hypothetical protein